jgi:enamine deaminase RidA (YjgF/YER057c/UK114 family)
MKPIYPGNPGDWKALYTPAMIVPAGKLAYISGQVAFDERGAVVGVGDIVTQAIRVFDNLGALLKASGSDFTRVIKTNYYITDVSLFPKVAELRPRYFSMPYPASTMVEVKGLVHPDLMLEIEAVALVD